MFCSLLLILSISLWGVHIRDMSISRDYRIYEYTGECLEQVDLMLETMRLW